MAATVGEDAPDPALSSPAFFFFFARGGGTAESLRTPEDSERTFAWRSLPFVFVPPARFFFDGVDGELLVDVLAETGSDALVAMEKVSVMDAVEVASSECSCDARDGGSGDSDRDLCSKCLGE